MYIERQLKRMEIVFTGYFLIIILLFIVIILLLFLYYLNDDLGVSNKKGNDRVDLQTEAESFPMVSKPSNGKTRKRRLYEASGVSIEHYHEKPKMVKSTLLPLSDER